MSKAPAKSNGEGKAAEKAPMEELVVTPENVQEMLRMAFNDAQRESDVDAVADILAGAIAKNMGFGTGTPDVGEIEIFQLLLTDDDKLSAKAEAAARDIFSEFDKGGKGYLTEEELDAFATKCNGEPFTDEDKEEMRDTFDCKDGNLTLEGFFQVFALQSAARPTDTIADFMKFGYDEELNKTADAKKE